MRPLDILLALCCAIALVHAAPRKKSRRSHHKSTHTRKPRAPRRALPPHLELPSDFATTAAYRYAQLSKRECEAELDVRHIPFVHERALGVLQPVRLTGALHGVLFRGRQSEAERATSVHEILDCRLVLALDDFATLLRRHGIVEVLHFSLYRLPPQSWRAGRQGRHHLGGVAIDAGRFITKDGRELDVDRHFHGAIGAKTCGEGARPRPATAEATELRAILCETVARRIFNLVLTPNYNPPHKNHFHLEVSPGVKWFLIH